MAKERPQEGSGVRKNSICPSRCCGLTIPGPTVHLAGFPGASMLQIPGYLTRAATRDVPHAPFPSRSILALGCFLGFFEREALKIYAVLGSGRLPTLSALFFLYLTIYRNESSHLFLRS